MTGERLTCVITTIRPPTASVRRLASHLSAVGATTLVVGDERGPIAYDLPGTRHLPLAAQRGMPFELAGKLPTGHYARKNLGYLEALAGGATCIYETDDDNHPLPAWRPRIRDVTARGVRSPGWFNAYSAFTEDLIWPRGFPLELVRSRPVVDVTSATIVTAPIQQGLANGSPDVDAVWRLILDRAFAFEPRESIRLERGSWCPFNSQSTWWWSPAFPLLYLPSFCSFRTTDILRSLVAQRCLWELGHGVVFHAPEVEQVRNEHDLMHDFQQELTGFTGNRRIAAILDGLALAGGADRMGENLLRCYEALVAGGFVAAEELALAESWVADVARATTASAR